MFNTKNHCLRRFILNAILILTAQFSLASEQLDDLSLIVIAKTEHADICINKHEQCTAIKDGEFFKPSDSIVIKNGSATIFSTQAKQTFDLFDGSYQMSELLSNSEPETDKNKLKSLLHINNRETSSLPTRQSDVSICQTNEIKKLWLNRCKLKSELPSTSDVIETELPLPEHSYYQEFPISLFDLSNYDSMIIANSNLCKSLKNVSKEEILKAFHVGEDMSVLTPGEFEWVQHDIQHLPDQCQEDFNKQLKELASQPNLDNLYKRYDLLERFGFKYEAMEALKQTVVYKTPVY